MLRPRTRSVQQNRIPMASSATPHSSRSAGCDDNLRRMGKVTGGTATVVAAAKGARLIAYGLAATAVAACTAKKPVEDTYFDRTVGPILQSSCVRTNTGANCHIANERGNAIGNLSLASYEELSKRRDLLINYGPYTQPAMLLKNIEPLDLLITAYDGTSFTVRTDIRHAGGQTLGMTSAGFHTVQQWIASGANANNAISPPAILPRDGCSFDIPEDPDFDPNSDPGTADYDLFKREVAPVLGTKCAASNCHGAASNALRLVCTESAD